MVVRRGRLKGEMEQNISEQLLTCVRRDLKAWYIGEEWASDRERWNESERPATQHRKTAAKGEK